jgi:hypothetical protein
MQSDRSAFMELDARKLIERIGTAEAPLMRGSLLCEMIAITMKSGS